MSVPAQTRLPGRLAGLGLARAFAIGAVVFVALVLQTTVLVRLTLLNVVPQLVLVVVVCLAYLDGEKVGLVAGFVGGLFLDLQFPEGAVLGLTALVYLLVGYAVGYLRQYFPGESVWMPVFAVAVASFVAEAGYGTLAILLGREWVSLTFTSKVIGLVVLYDTLLTPFIFPLVRRVADRVRPEKVYRF